MFQTWNMEISESQKFLCGIVLQVNNIDYYVPVTSYTQQKPDNFLIKADNGQVTSSLRFNYMFPIPKELVAERTIAGEPDRAYPGIIGTGIKVLYRKSGNHSAFSRAYI